MILAILVDLSHNLVIIHEHTVNMITRRKGSDYTRGSKLIAAAR